VAQSEEGHQWSPDSGYIHSALPARVTPGDTTLVQVQLNFNGGDVATTIGSNPDGSWAANITFTFRAITGPTSLSAYCVDFNGHGGKPYADYRARPVRVVP
jgi:hypothetical protein